MFIQIVFLVPTVELHINYCSAVFRGNLQLSRSHGDFSPSFGGSFMHGSDLRILKHAWVSYSTLQTLHDILVPWVFNSDSYPPTNYENSTEPVPSFQLSNGFRKLDATSRYLPARLRASACRKTITNTVVGNCGASSTCRLIGVNDIF